MYLHPLSLPATAHRAAVAAVLKHFAFYYWKSMVGVSFRQAGSVAASGNGSHHYQFTETARRHISPFTFIDWKWLTRMAGFNTAILWGFITTIQTCYWLYSPILRTILLRSFALKSSRHYYQCRRPGNWKNFTDQRQPDYKYEILENRIVFYQDWRWGNEDQAIEGKNKVCIDLQKNPGRQMQNL